MDDMPKTKEELIEELESLRKHLSELEAVNEELFHYTDIVSHDLKAPLRAIHNYADFLRVDIGGTLHSEQKMYFDSLCAAVRQGERLIEDLLSLSRIERLKPDIENIELHSFLRDLVDSLGLGSEVEIVLVNRDRPVIQTQAVLFRRVFLNLLTNAVRFNRSSPKRIEIGWREAGDNGYELFVRDNGIGIPAAHHKKIFGVFQRLHTEHEYEGTG